MHARKPLLKLVAPLAAITAAISLTPIASAEPTANNESDTTFCDAEVPYADDQESGAEKVEKMTSNDDFAAVANRQGLNEKKAAEWAADYFSEEEVDTILEGIQGKASEPSLRVAPWELECSKAWAGYLLYQAQGIAVCGPMAIANPLAGVVCNIVKAGGGSFVDFNKVC